MTTNAQSTPSTSFIERAEALYPSNPLQAAVVLTDGVKDLLAAHGLPLEPPTDPQNGLLMYPGKRPRQTAPEQILDDACYNLAQTAQEAAAGIAPEPWEWERDVHMARTAVQFVELLHG